MRSVWLDFQRPPPGRQWPGLALFLIAGALTGLLANHYLALQDQLDRAEVRLQKLQRQAERTRRDAAIDPTRSTVDSEVLAHLNENSPDRWTTRFAVFEEAATDQIALVALIPEKSQITANGEAKNLAAALDYLQRIQRAPVIASAHLAETEVIKEKPLHPLRFTLVARWKGVSP